VPESDLGFSGDIQRQLNQIRRDKPKAKEGRDLGEESGIILDISRA